MFHFRVKPLGCVTISALFIGLTVFAFGPLRDTLFPAPAPSANITGTPAPDIPKEIVGFSTVAKSDVSVRVALSASAQDDAQKKMGETATVSGTISQITVVENRKDTLLRFNGPEEATLFLIIGDDERPQFPDLNALIGRRVLAKGDVIAYKDKPAVKVMAPDQIRVVAP